MEHRAAWTPDALAKRLAALDLAPETDRADPFERDWPHVAATAVLSTFVPGTLRGIDGQPANAGTLERLTDACTIVYGGPAGRWRLLPDLRRRALRRLATRAQMADALRANPDREQDTLQSVLDSYIAGSVPPLGDLDTEQLACAFEVSRWLDGVLDDVPDPDQVGLALDMAHLLDPFRALADQGFRGRTDELRRLRRYVGEHESSALESIRWGVGFHERPPLMISGLGGIGKSTLLARFILEHADAPRGERVWFAYLDFDRADVDASEPLSILFEAARQLAAQHPELRDELLAFRRRWRRALAESAQDASIEALSSLGAEIAIGNQYAHEACANEFAALAGRAIAHEAPLVLVLDTFEEVQYGSPAFVRAIWDLLAMVQHAVPTLRTVIAGRAPLDKFRTDDLKLRPLDGDAAVALLEANGVRDAKTARMIVKYLGGNPLTLRLAAEVVRQDAGSTTALAEVRGRARRLKTLFGVREQAVQALLYGRILRHVHVPEIAQLAHPGLTLRRITPELIAEVLAGPCGLGQVDAERAQRLFDELVREVSLVVMAPDGALEHRSDVRRTMLPLLRADERDAVAAIHAGAIEYYAAQDTDLARGEELYHRLALDQDRVVLVQHWTRDAGRRVQGSLEELPARAQAFVAVRLGLEVDKAIQRHARLEDVERKVEQEARDLLRIGRPADALELLRGQSRRTELSALHLLEAVAAREVSEYAAAEAAVTRGLDAVEGVGTSRAELELFQFAATLKFEQDDVGEGVRYLELAHGAAVWLNDTAQAGEIQRQLETA